MTINQAPLGADETRARAKDVLGDVFINRFYAVVDEHYVHRHPHADTHNCLPSLVAHGQQPEYCLIGCSDSRTLSFMPDQPGQVFCIRTAGGLVVNPQNAHQDLSVWSSIEVALSFPSLKSIVVQHHGLCGFQRLMMQGVPRDTIMHSMMELFAENKAQACKNHEPSSRDAKERLAIYLMNDTIKNIAAHPVIKERIKAGTLDLFGMMLNMGEHEHRPDSGSSVFRKPSLELFLTNPKAKQGELPGAFVPYAAMPERTDLHLEHCPHFPKAPSPA